MSAIYNQDMKLCYASFKIKVQSKDMICKIVSKHDLKTSFVYSKIYNLAYVPPNSGICLAIQLLIDLSIQIRDWTKIQIFVSRVM